jgi:AAA15 family ATPase/GTPase
MDSSYWSRPYEKVIRFKNNEDLFSEKLTANRTILIETHDHYEYDCPCTVRMDLNDNKFLIRLEQDGKHSKEKPVAGYSIQGELSASPVNFSKELKPLPRIKYYRFDPFLDFTENYSYQESFLQPPFGKNLFQVLAKNSAILDTVAPYFEQYGYEVHIDSHKTFVIDKKQDRTRVPIDLALTADTLRRMIFHVTALMSNTDSILLFDEPESHAFPTYIDEFANRMAFDKNNNQFFITTHSPYIINNLLDSDFEEDVNIYIVYLENFTTKVRLLTEEDLRIYTQYGADVFFNIRNFIPSDSELETV